MPAFADSCNKSLSYWQDLFFAIFVGAKLKTIQLHQLNYFPENLGFFWFFFLIFTKTARCEISSHQTPPGHEGLAELSACLHREAQNSTGVEAEFNAHSITAEHGSSNSFFLGNTLKEPSCNMQFVTTSKVKTFQVKNMQQMASSCFDLFTINHKVIKLFLKQIHAVWRNTFFPSKLKQYLRGEEKKTR